MLSNWSQGHPDLRCDRDLYLEYSDLMNLISVSRVLELIFWFWGFFVPITPFKAILPNLGSER